MAISRLVFFSLVFFSTLCPLPILYYPSSYQLISTSASSILFYVSYLTLFPTITRLINLPSKPSRLSKNLSVVKILTAGLTQHQAITIPLWAFRSDLFYLWPLQTGDKLKDGATRSVSIRCWVRTTCPGIDWTSLLTYTRDERHSTKGLLFMFHRASGGN